MVWKDNSCWMASLGQCLWRTKFAKELLEAAGQILASYAASAAPSARAAARVVKELMRLVKQLNHSRETATAEDAPVDPNNLRLALQAYEDVLKGKLLKLGE